MVAFLRFKKWKIIVISIILVVAGMFTYIRISSTNINKMAYMKLAYPIADSLGYVPDNWEQLTSVTLVDLKFYKGARASSKNLKARINMMLLVLNGRYAVRVNIPVYLKNMGMDSPSIYFNPFTKQFIAMDRIM